MTTTQSARREDGGGARAAAVRGRRPLKARRRDAQRRISEWRHTRHARRPRRVPAATFESNKKTKHEPDDNIRVDARDVRVGRDVVRHEPNTPPTARHDGVMVVPPRWGWTRTARGQRGGVSMRNDRESKDRGGEVEHSTKGDWRSPSTATMRATAARPGHEARAKIKPSVARESDSERITLASTSATVPLAQPLTCRTTRAGPFSRKSRAGGARSRSVRALRGARAPPCYLAGSTSTDIRTKQQRVRCVTALL